MKIALVAFGNEESYGLLIVGGEFLLHGQMIKFFDAEEDDIMIRLTHWEPDFICFSPMTTFFSRALNISRKIKRVFPRVVSVFGGHHAMSSPSIADLEEVDIVVVGPIRGAVKQIRSKTHGIIRTCLTYPHDMAKPAREQYYRDIPRMANRYRKIMLSMFGCPWNCSYCSSASGHLQEIFGPEAHKRYYLARRSIPSIIEEAKELLKYKTVEIEWVDDDILFGDDIETWIPSFVEAWEKDIGLPMYVSTTSFYVRKASDNVLSTLKRIVNCVGLGVQAIMPESRKLFNRAWDNEEKMKEAYERLTSLGYRINLQCIVGLPVKDPFEDAMETVKTMQRIGPGSICSCYPLQVYPGTKMEDFCHTNKVALNSECNGDTNSGIPAVKFSEITTKRLKNLCKLATLFVKYNISEDWMRPMLDIDYNEKTSKALSTVRYFECVNDRLMGKGQEVFEDIIKTMRIRY